MNEIIQGDCIEVLKTMPENSVDSIVTDPPYELSFMGKGWDNTGIANDKNMWEEALRVLKPGGYLLSFGGTRTFHRMTCAIEDAGFEIRDCIMWVYGCLSEDTEIYTINGWERYHKDIVNNLVLCYDVDKNSFEFHKPLRDFIYENKYPAYKIQSDYTDQIVSRNHRVLVERGGKLIFQRAEELQPQENIPFLESMPDLSNTISSYNEGTGGKKQGLPELYQGENREMEYRKIQNGRNYLQGLWQKFQTKMGQNKNNEVLLSTMFGENSHLAKTLFSKWQGKIKTWNMFEWRQKSSVERWSNLFQKTRELLADKICQVSERILGYGSKRRLCYGTPTDNGSISKSVLTTSGGGASYQSQSAGQPTGKSDVISFKQTPQITRSTITKTEYNGKVWCVEVPTGAFVARRNGKIFITGNSGFPKSLNIGKSVDKLQGNEREDLGKHPTINGKGDHFAFCANYNGARLTKGTSEWEGWGTALKPALEPITVARKPLSEKTVAENCLKWGVGGINIDGCRVGTQEELGRNNHTNPYGNERTWSVSKTPPQNNVGKAAQGRFPANFIHDGSDEVVSLFPNSKAGKNIEQKGTGGIWGKSSGLPCGEQYGDSGSASRFFYCAKASKSERNMGCEGLEEKKSELNSGGIGRECSVEKRLGDDNVNAPKMRNCHPTVKPLALMEYLIKLVTPPKGIVLDPFLGSGTTAVAAQKLGFNWIGIEKEAEYVKIARARIKAVPRTLL